MAGKVPGLVKKARDRNKDEAEIADLDPTKMRPDSKKTRFKQGVKKMGSKAKGFGCLLERP